MINHKENHGKVGKVLYIKMTLAEFNRVSKNNITIPNKTTISIEELEGKYGAVTAVPIMIDEETQGDYEAVCENGTEIHYWDE